MRKILVIVALGLLLNVTAYAQIDKSYVKQIYEGCISDAKQNNDYNSDSKKFCKCYANEFNKKFNNDQLIEFLSKSDQEKAQIIQNEISPMCLGNTSTQTNSTKKTEVKKIKINFNSYQDAYFDAWNMCLKRQIGTFSNNALLYLDAEKCLRDEDADLIVEYMPDISPNLAYEMFGLVDQRHFELFDLAKKVSKIFVRSEYESSSVHEKIANDWVDNQYIIYNKYFKKQKDLLRKNNVILY